MRIPHWQLVAWTSWPTSQTQQHFVIVSVRAIKWGLQTTSAAAEIICKDSRWGCDLALQTRPARMAESECWLLSGPFLQMIGLQNFDAAALKVGSGWLVFRVGMAAFPPSGCCETADCCGLDGVSRPDFHVPNIRAFHRNMRSLFRSACAD
jgi:hypothetical protein